MNECKPLLPGHQKRKVAKRANFLEKIRVATAVKMKKKGKKGPSGRGLHSSTLQLNLSALYGSGGAPRDCAARVKRVLGGV